MNVLHILLKRKYVARSLERTTRWLRRCDDHHRRLETKSAMETGSDTMKQALFGIMQGGMFKDLRELSAKQITEIDLPGYAIGGLSVGEPKDIMLDVLDDCVDLLPEDKPRYLMGVGTPDYLFESVERGVDMFDCVLPTRLARHGMAMTTEVRLISRMLYLQGISALWIQIVIAIAAEIIRVHI